MVGFSFQTKSRARRPNKPSRHVDPVTTFAVGLLVGLTLRFVDGKVAGPAQPSTTIAGAATTPTAIPAKGWIKIIQGAAQKFSENQIPAVAAGVTFFGLLALFPALSAFASLYGLFADVDQARQQVVQLAGLLPGGAVTVIGDQMQRLAQANHTGLGMTFVGSLLVSLWSSNAGMKALLGGLNAAYQEHEKRKFIVLNAISLSFTMGATVLAVLVMAVVAAAPATLTHIGLAHLAPLSLLRWPLLLVIVCLLLSFLYRFGPDRAHARWRWITPGSAVAALGWMGASILFSWYVANYGHYNATYGSLGAVVGFMTWIWLSLNIMLFGAELNAQLELATTVDTTIGRARPAGQRGAAVADGKADSG